MVVLGCVGGGENADIRGWRMFVVGGLLLCGRRRECRFKGGGCLLVVGFCYVGGGDNADLRVEVIYWWCVFVVGEAKRMQI